MIQKILAFLRGTIAVIAMVGIFLLQCVWQALPLVIGVGIILWLLH